MGHGSRNYDEIVAEIDKKARENKEDMMFLFTGVGEPLMLPNFLEVCKIVNNMKIPFNIESNGIKLSNFEFCEKLKKLGLRNVSLTFCSHIPSVYNKIIGGYKYYNHILKALENIEKLKINISLQIVILKHNLDHFHMIPMFIKKNFPEIKITSVILHLVRINEPIEMFKQVGFPLSENAKKIENSVLHLKDEGFIIDLSTSAGTFPFCFFPSFIREFEYDKKPITKDAMHVKTKYCEGCKYYEQCHGIPYTYLKIYGEEEFRGMNSLEYK